MLHSILSINIGFNTLNDGLKLVQLVVPVISRGLIEYLWHHMWANLAGDLNANFFKHKTQFVSDGQDS